MVFTVFTIFAVFIGSSYAEVSDINRIESLLQVHTQVNAYIRTLANASDELGYLLTTKQYMDYLEQHQILSVALANMAHNDKLALYPKLKKPVESAGKLFEAWHKIAFDLIIFFNKEINIYINGKLAKDSPDVIIKPLIISSTMQLLWSTHEDRHIIDEHKKEKFPVHIALGVMINSYGGDVLYKKYLQDYGSRQTYSIIKK